MTIITKIFCTMILRRSRSTPFPYTTLFRSRDHLLPAVEMLGAVPPHRVERVRPGDRHRIAGVPGVLGGLDLLQGALAGEGRHGRLRRHGDLLIESVQSASDHRRWTLVIPRSFLPSSCWCTFRRAPFRCPRSLRMIDA